jgi:hypothetical protein
MKNLILIFILMTSVLAEAGAISGGGGKAVVCRDSNGAIKSATTLDLYEGKILYSLYLPESDDPVDVQVKKALTVIPTNSDPSWGGGMIPINYERKFVEDYTVSVRQNMHISYGTVLQPIDDANVVAIPRGCQAEQLANYFNDHNILINGDIWDKLSATAKASLILHEAVYANERSLGATTSLRSRHIVASLFDPTTKWVDILDGLPANPLNCFSGNASFYAYKLSGHWILQFTNIGEGAVMSKKTVTLSDNHMPLGASLDQFFTGYAKIPVQGEDKIGIFVSDILEISSDFEAHDQIVINYVWEPLKDDHGQIIKGYQVPNAYLASWKSGTYPNSQSQTQTFISCNLVQQ